MITSTADLEGYTRRDGFTSLEQLEGRSAKCGDCDRTTPSVGTEHHRGLPAFFEFRGEGSHFATGYCGVSIEKVVGRVTGNTRTFRCGRTPAAHQAINPTTQRPGITDHAFTPRGAQEFDSFYCGCRGWE